MNVFWCLFGVNVLLQELSRKPPPEGLRGEELLRWATYINKGGLIAPLVVEQRRSSIHYSGFFRMEDEGPPTTATPLQAPIAIEISSLPEPPSRQNSGPLLTSTLVAKRWTALHVAVCDGNLDQTRSLLLSGAFRICFIGTIYKSLFMHCAQSDAKDCAAKRAQQYPAV